MNEKERRHNREKSCAAEKSSGNLYSTSPQNKLRRRKHVHEQNQLEIAVRHRQPPHRSRVHKLPEKLVEMTSRHRDHPSKSPDPAGHRVSLPVKPARFGPIFGNMHVSDKMSRDKVDGVLAKKGKVTGQGFTPNSRHEKLPELIQRFLQEPSLVSIGDTQEPDDLAWLEQNSVSDAGVTERCFDRQEPPRKRSRRKPIVNNQSPKMIPHKSGMNRHVELEQPHSEEDVPAVRQSKWVSRGTSPIVTMPLRGEKRSVKHTYQSRDEAVQTRASGVSGMGSEDESIGHSTALNINSGPELGLSQQTHVSNVFSGNGHDSGSQEHRTEMGGEPIVCDPAVAEQVVLGSGEIAYLIRTTSSVAILSQPEHTEQAPQVELSRHLNRSACSLPQDTSKKCAELSTADRSLDRAPPTSKMTSKSTGAAASNSASDFQFNPLSIFSQPQSAPEEIGKLFQGFASHDRAVSSVHFFRFNSNHSIAGGAASEGDAETNSIVSHYMTLANQQRSCSIAGHPQRTEPVLDSGRMSCATPSSLRVYPRKMF